MQKLVSKMRTRKGFTLVELAVVIVIIGILAAFGVPKFLQSVEKSKAAEAFNFWLTVQAAQERYIAQNGIYFDSSSSTGNLDIILPTLQYFSGGTMTASNGTSGTPAWTGTLTRNGSTSFGPYTIVWTDQGFSTSSTIPQSISPVTGDAGSGS